MRTKGGRFFSKKQFRAVEAEIAALLETKTPSGSEHWQTALTWARAHAPELALGIYRRWTPVGRCSMDTRPQEVAREYADLCWERGRLGCLLQLQVQIMGNQFSRVAYSSYGEAAHDPESTRLDDAGVDVERFFRGLTMRFAIDGPVGRELPPWRIGKAAAGATPKGLRATFERIATDRSVDDYNRLRAAQVLVGLIAAERGTSYEDGLDAIDALDVPPTTKVFTELERAP